MIGFGTRVSLGDTCTLTLWNGRSFRGMGLGPEAENYVLIPGEI